MITKTQHAFIMFFIEDGDRDFNATCTQLGILPSEASRWFADSAFHKAMHKAQVARLARLGYGPLLVIEDTLAIAHSDVTKVMSLDGDHLVAQSVERLPRATRVAIKSIEYAVAFKLDGESFVYPKKITMHDKMAALAKAAEWYDVANHEATKGGGATSDGPKRISGLVVRPPVSEDVAEGEKLLDG